MIETTLARIADALERLAVRIEEQAGIEPPAPPQKVADLIGGTPKEEGAKASASKVEQPEPEAKAQPTELTLDALRKSLAPLDPAQGRALLEQFGVKKVSELQPEQYMDVLKAAKGAK